MTNRVESCELRDLAAWWQAAWGRGLRGRAAPGIAFSWSRPEGGSRLVFRLRSEPRRLARPRPSETPSTMATPSPRSHRGLAQRVRALFDDPPAPPEVDGEQPFDVAWVSETGRPVGSGPRGEQGGEPLAEAVEAYVLAGPGGGEEAASVLDRAIQVARRGPATPQMADAVESLLRYAVRDEAALERARALASPGVTALLVRRLAQLTDPGRRDRLLQWLPELGQGVREATLEAFRTPPPQGVPRGAAAQGLLRLLDTLARNTPGMLEELVQDPDWRVVSAVISITSDRGGDGALQILTVALNHDHPRVRSQALAALRKLGGGEAGELALGMLEDRDRSVRAEAVRTVGELNVSRGSAPLVERLAREDHPEVLLATIQALGELRDPSTVSELEGWVGQRIPGESDLALRGAAFRALHRIGTPRALRVLEDVAGDGDPAVRELVRPLLESGSSEAETIDGGGIAAE